MQVSVKEAALMLELDEDALWRLIGQGDIPAHLVNEEYRFNKAELFEWATARGLKVSHELFPDREGELPGLGEALARGGIARNLAAGDAPSALRSLVGVLALPEDVDRDYLYQVMLARENLGSTGIGEGIAIPHVRNPVVLRGAPSSVTLGFLAAPIDFHAIDRVPVDTLFAIVSPSVRVHLHLLSRLGSVLRVPAFRAILRSRAPDAAILSALAEAEAGFVSAAPGQVPE